MAWTEQRVRDELPEVLIEVQGVVSAGQVSGRFERYAHVSFLYHGYGFCAEWSWEAVVRALETGEPLQYDRWRVGAGQWVVNRDWPLATKN